MPMTLSGSIQVGLPAGAFADAAKAAENFEWEEEIGNSLVVREPVGVVGAITPWNYPLYQIALKVAPALAAGCTVVLKPSEVAPLNAFVLAEVIDEVGLPPGVFNLVSGVGPGRRRGHRLPPQGRHGVVHRLDPGRATGHGAGGRGHQAGVARAGRQVGQHPARRRRLRHGRPGRPLRLLHELGPDLLGPHPHARPPGPAGRGGGDGGRRHRAGFAPGDPFEAGKLLGPLVSAVQRDRVRGYINKGIDEGAKLVAGGAEAPEGLEKGFFVQPTVFSEVTPDMTIAKEEIFGPVLSIIPYDTEEEAIEIANGTPYGLAGAVWAATRPAPSGWPGSCAPARSTSTVGASTPSAPFGGYKQSGIGRERGRYGLEEFLETKSMQR